MLGTYTATIVERRSAPSTTPDSRIVSAQRTDLRDIQDLLASGVDHERRLSEGDVCLIARDEEGPLGLLWLNLVSHSDRYLGPWSRPSTTVAYYNQLQVSPAHRRRGIARSLVLAALDECVRAERAVLRAAVLRGNTASRALHEALGFRPVAVVRGARIGPMTVRVPGAAPEGID